MNYELFSIFAQKFSNKTVAISKNQIKFIRQLEQKKFRRREGLFVAEGMMMLLRDIFIMINSMKMINIQHLLLLNQEKYMLISQTMMHIDGEEQHMF